MSLERVNTWVGIGSGVLGCLSALVALLRILPAERRRRLFRWLAGGAVVLGVTATVFLLARSCGPSASAHPAVSSTAGVPDGVRAPVELPLPARLGDGP